MIIFYKTWLKCYSFSLTFFIKVSRLNVIYKTFDFIIPLGVRILNTLEQMCFWIKIDTIFYKKNNNNNQTKQNLTFSKTTTKQISWILFLENLFSLSTNQTCFSSWKHEKFVFSFSLEKKKTKIENENNYQTWP